MDLVEAIELRTDAVAETRLWRAVIVSAVHDWMSGGLRTQREAEVYLFGDDVDFPRVCESAGMDVKRLRSRLRNFRSR